MPLPDPGGNVLTATDYIILLIFRRWAALRLWKSPKYSEIFKILRKNADAWLHNNRRSDSTFTVLKCIAVKTNKHEFLLDDDFTTCIRDPRSAE